MPCASHTVTNTQITTPQSPAWLAAVVWLSKFDRSYAHSIGIGIAICHHCSSVLYNNHHTFSVHCTTTCSFALFQTRTLDDRDRIRPRARARECVLLILHAISPYTPVITHAFYEEHVLTAASTASALRLHYMSACARSLSLSLVSFRPTPLSFEE